MTYNITARKMRKIAKLTGQETGLAFGEVGYNGIVNPFVQTAKDFNGVRYVFRDKAGCYASFEIRMGGKLAFQVDINKSLLCDDIVRQLAGFVNAYRTALAAVSVAERSRAV